MNTYIDIINALPDDYSLLKSLPDDLKGSLTALNFCHRQGIKTNVIFVNRHAVNDVFNHLNISNIDIDTIFPASNDVSIANVGIELEALVGPNPMCRFYILTVDLETDVFSDTYPMNHDISQYGEMQKLGIGVYYDKYTGLVTHYKHYYHSRSSNGAYKTHNFRFLADQTFVNLKVERGSNSLQENDIISELFSEEIAALDGVVEDFAYSTRPDGQSYLIPKIIISEIASASDSNSQEPRPLNAEESFIEEGAISGEEFIVNTED